MRLVLLTLWALVIASLIAVALADSLPAALARLAVGLALLVALIACDARARLARLRREDSSRARCGACREALDGAVDACPRCLASRHRSCAGRTCQSAACRRSSTPAGPTRAAA